MDPLRSIPHSEDRFFLAPLTSTGQAFERLPLLLNRYSSCRMSWW